MFQIRNFCHCTSLLSLIVSHMAKWSLIQYLSSQRVLNTFLQNNQTTTLLMTIHPIIETIFHKYKDRVIGEEEICAHLLQVYMSTAMHLFFDPDDKFVLSNANFFLSCLFLASAQRRLQLICGNCAQRTHQSLPASSSSFQS